MSRPSSGIEPALTQVQPGIVATRECIFPIAAGNALPPSPKPPRFQERGYVRALQFFQEQTAPKFSAYFPDDLWVSWIPRLAYADDGIGHALISMASYHELFSRAVEPASSFNSMAKRKLTILALSQYNSAISSISDIAPQTMLGTEFRHLVSCVVFLAIEMLRGQIACAINLLTYGKQLLEILDKQEALLLIDQVLILKLVRALFARLTYQAVWLVGDKAPGHCFSQCYDRSLRWPDDGHLKFKDFHQAREYFFFISLNRASIPIHETVKRFSIWCDELDTFSTSWKSATGEHQSARDGSYQALQLYRAHFQIEIKAQMQAQHDDSIVWDQYGFDYNQIIDLVTQVQPVIHNRSSAAHFQMAISTVPILWYVITRCRIPRIRQRALSALESRTVQEGLIKSDYIAAIARRVIDVEQREHNVTSCVEVPFRARVAQSSSADASTTRSFACFDFLADWASTPAKLYANLEASGSHGDDILPSYYDHTTLG
ncbi:hypothetical protein NLG97_g2635 [Lecanicillium saksenae]|uniref:Uncharacterized protein n=1 Tax=Lecanicillium saksenae TaxID=468837 RepID=A0ACC1R233_9HYPO|nr:hypothetical protein NLG97_g2635 [Lecanicillium saksenae]